MTTNNHIRPVTDEHAAYAAANPPSPGYTCGPHAVTYGGGCFNCGWDGGRCNEETK